LVARFYCAICLWLLFTAVVGVVDLLCPGETVSAGLPAMESVVREFVYHQYDIAAHIINKIFWLVHQIFLLWISIVRQLLLSMMSKHSLTSTCQHWIYECLAFSSKVLVRLTLVLQRDGMTTYHHKFLRIRT